MIPATNETTNNFNIVPAGTYVARCYSMVQIGTIEEEYLGQKKEMNKVRITWELPTELKEFKQGDGEKPYSVSKDFTLSMYEKANLRKFLEGWRGKGFSEEEAKSFDITALLGKPCMISIIHKVSKQNKPYAEISSVTSLPKGIVCPDQVNKNFEFSFHPFEKDKFDKLPEWLQNKIKTSKEYKLLNEPNNIDISNNDDLPF